MTEKNNAVKQNSMKSNKRLNKLVAALACLCVLLTGYLMMQPALSMNIQDYATAHGGSVSFTLKDTNNAPIEKDENGNLKVVAGTTYILSVHFNLPEGILPGTYEYQLPDELVVDENEGHFVLKNGTHVGDWKLDSTGKMTFAFNQNSNKQTDMTITATMGIHFSADYEKTDFDGNIHVVILKPEVEKQHTELEKWGVQGAEGNPEGTDPSKIYWTIEIKGHEGSTIPSSVLTDTLLSSNLKYTEIDIKAGIKIGVSKADGSGYHEWTIDNNTPGFEWNDSSWSYAMPKTIICEGCQASVALTNENTTYFVKFTSTADTTVTGGLVYFGNNVMIDGEDATFWGSMVHGEKEGQVVKKGSFVGTDVGGKFVWTISAIVPGKKANQRADYFWTLYDGMKVTTSEGAQVDTVINDINSATITAIRNGQKINVPELSKVTDSDQIAWNCHTNSQGPKAEHTINLLCRCTCTEENCARWEKGACNWREALTNSNGVYGVTDFCHCWNLEDDTVFNITYETPGVDVVDEFGGKGYNLTNVATLAKQNIDETGKPIYFPVDTKWDNVSIPGMFKKELSEEMDGYIAHYTITVNEAKTVLTENGEPLTIHDEMTDTLAYMNGSLVITTEDINGNTGTLREGIDYTVTYDGSGNEKDSSGKPVHALDITLLYPAPVKYTLKYNTAVIVPGNATTGVEFHNSATVTLKGKTLTADSAKTVFSDFNFSAKTHKVGIEKHDFTDSDRCLPGAVFGLYNEQGGLITQGTTDENGKLVFETNIQEGIILREHVPYYIQEIESPDGYVLEDTKYWFCFCEKDLGPNGEVQECSYKTNIPGVDDNDVRKIPGDELKIITITNAHVSYVLPDAGGGGARIFVIAGMILVIGSAAALAIRRRKQYNM